MSNAKMIAFIPSGETLSTIDTLRLERETRSGCIDRLLSNLAIFLSADDYAATFGAQQPNIRRRPRGIRNKRRGE